MNERSTSIVERVASVARAIVGRRRSRDEDRGGAIPVEWQERRLDDRRTEARFQIVEPEEPDEALRLILPPSTVEHPIRDLSTHGISFESLLPVEELPPVGSGANAEVVLGQVQVPVQLHLVNIRDRQIGCKVLEVSTEWLDEVSRVLDPFRLGQQLREIDPRFVRQDDEELRLSWYQSGPACELFVWEEPDHFVHKVQLFFMWQLVEWSRAHGLRTGEVEIQPRPGPRYAMSEQYHLASPPDNEALTFTRRLMTTARLPDQVCRLFF